MQVASMHADDCLELGSSLELQASLAWKQCSTLSLKGSASAAAWAASASRSCPDSAALADSSASAYPSNLPEA